MLRACEICPRRCGVDRVAGEIGYCSTGAELAVASVCRHIGEEPVLGGVGGVCNVFFLGCNLHCVYCQNYQISHARAARIAARMNPREVVERIWEMLDSGMDTLGLVSPSHQVIQAVKLLEAVFHLGKRPTVVYNSNGYDTCESLGIMEGMVDIYLPDFKYADEKIAKRFSEAAEYPGIALRALEMMIRQVGTGLEIDEAGTARRGVIVRHLVLPGMVDNSIAVLRLLADHFGAGLHLSLMAQYRPPPALFCPPPLNRGLTLSEYRQVVDEALNLGFENGWFQDPGSSDRHVPDFAQENPFGSL